MNNLIIVMYIKITSKYLIYFNSELECSARIRIFI